jgi:hypothetical protein
MFERSDFADGCLHRWLDCRRPTSGQPGKHYCEYEKLKCSVSPEITVSADGKHHIAQKPNIRREWAVAERERKNWRELCNAALGANDPDELLKILQELNRVLKREEQVRVISGRP